MSLREYDGIADNFHKIEEEYDELADQPDTYELVIANVMEYAFDLHDKEGYYIFNDSVAAKKVVKWLEKTANATGDDPLTETYIERALDAAGYDIVNFLTSLTGELAPPVGAQSVERSGGDATYVPPKGRGEGPRQAHPGHWADVTGALVSAYKHYVNGGAVKDHNSENVDLSQFETLPAQ